MSAAPLMLIGSELRELAELKAKALAELESGLALYRHRHDAELRYFGLHTKQVQSPYQVLNNLYWHDVNPGDHGRIGLIASIRQEEQFIEVVAAVLSKMACVRYRQKSFRFTQSEAKTA